MWQADNNHDHGSHTLLFELYLAHRSTLSHSRELGLLSGTVVSAAVVAVACHVAALILVQMITAQRDSQHTQETVEVDLISICMYTIRIVSSGSEVCEGE